MSSRINDVKEEVRTAGNLRVLLPTPACRHKAAKRVGTKQPSVPGHLHADTSQALNQAVFRMETANVQHGRKIEERLRNVEDKIDRRLYKLETRQTRLSSCMNSLHSDRQALRSENEDLGGTVSYLIEKCDYMENRSRRNNLVFTGLAPVRGGSESWKRLRNESQGLYQ